jgi:hypothetical protein
LQRSSSGSGSGSTAVFQHSRRGDSSSTAALVVTTAAQLQRHWQRQLQP